MTGRMTTGMSFAANVVNPLATRTAQQSSAGQRTSRRNSCSSFQSTVFSSDTRTTAPSSLALPRWMIAPCTTSATAARSFPRGPGAAPGSQRADRRPRSDVRKTRASAGLSTRCARAPIRRSVLDLGRQLAAIGGELGHHLLVQPDVHARGVVGVTAIAELLGQLLARSEAGIDVERL